MSLEILKQYKIKAKKKLGQNFLVNEEIINDIWTVIEVEWKNIIEVWPWYWALTEKLLWSKPKSLNLVELDNDMIDILEDRINNWDLDTSGIDFKINNKDILKYVPESDKYDVIANIPYYITSPILRHFLYEVKNKPENMVILMQKDVWDKILWFWKDKSSVLSLIVDKKSYVSEKIFVSKDNFRPVPKVESSVLLFETHKNFTDIPDENFLKIIKIWFNAVRKKLVKNLEKGWYEKNVVIGFLKEIGHWENVRWEELNIKDWCSLVKLILEKYSDK